MNGLFILLSVYCPNVTSLCVCRIHFAGTETATRWCGFINGAAQSGRRAAMEVSKTFHCLLCFVFKLSARSSQFGT